LKVESTAPSWDAQLVVCSVFYSADLRDLTKECHSVVTKASASVVHLESMMVEKWAAKREALRADCSVHCLAAGWELLWAEQMVDRKGGS
jgi:hypothetical protein